MTLPIAAIEFDRDLSARHALTIRAIPAVTWRNLDLARASMTYALGTACCAVLVARLRLVAAQMRAECPTPAMGFRHV